MLTPIRRALLSVSDKSGIVELARALVARGTEILSTGGTARLLAAEGIAYAEVLRTLHPLVDAIGNFRAVIDNAQVQP